MQIRLGDVWDDMLAFARREQALVIPVALALFGLPQLMIGLLLPLLGNAVADTTAAALLYLCVLLVVLVSLLGNLALSALVLRPGGSVGEALIEAVRRMPGAVGAAGIALLIALVGCIPLAVILTLLGVSMDARAPTPGSALVIVLLMALIVTLAARLAPIWAWMVGHGQGGWAAIRGTFSSTRAVAWRLLLVMLFFLVTVQVVLWSVAMIGRPVGLLTGSPQAVNVVTAILAALISAAGTAMWTLFCACLYRRLDEPDTSALFE